MSLRANLGLWKLILGSNIPRDKYTFYNAMNYVFTLGKVVESNRKRRASGIEVNVHTPIVRGGGRLGNGA